MGQRLMTVTVATVLTGSKYNVSDVMRIYRMVSDNLDSPCNFVCITDKPAAVRSCQLPIEPVTVSFALPKWWAKMKLFDLSWRNRNSGQIIYFDLDTLICGPLEPLVSINTEFAICRNFTKAHGNARYPCDYGSCVMSIAPDFGNVIWERFVNKADDFINGLDRRYGDQYAIQKLWPNANYLQDMLPPDYIISYRAVKGLASQPPDVSLVAYAGGRTPATMGPHWAYKIWNRSEAHAHV